MLTSEQKKINAEFIHTFNQLESYLKSKEKGTDRYQSFSSLVNQSNNKIINHGENRQFLFLVADLRNMRSATMKADDIASILAYVEHLHEREKQQEEVIRQTGEAVEEKRKYLVEAVKNRKVMENLKDRHEQDYIKDFNETEQKNSDEMSVLKFGRRVK